MAQTSREGGQEEKMLVNIKHVDLGAQCSCREPRFGSQHPGWAVHNCLYLLLMHKAQDRQGSVETLEFFWLLVFIL